MLTGANKAKMVYASWQLANQENPHQTRSRINSTTYSRIKEEFSKVHSAWMKENHHTITEKTNAYWTEENRKIHAEKISRVTKGRVVSEKAKESYRNKIWTDKAIENRLNNCLKGAASRKGKTWKLINGKRVYFDR